MWKRLRDAGGASKPFRDGQAPAGMDGRAQPNSSLIPRKIWFGSARVAGIIWGEAQPHPLVGWANPGCASPELQLWKRWFQAVSSRAGGTGRMLPQHTTALRASRQHQKTGEEKNLISSKGKWLVEKDKELQQPELWKALTKYLKWRNRKCFPSVRAFLMQVIRWLLPLLLKRHYFLSDPCKEGLEHTYSFSMCF